MIPDAYIEYKPSILKAEVKEKLREENKLL
jgi:hypothetical protein